MINPKATSGVTEPVTHSNPAGQNPVALNTCSSVSGSSMPTKHTSTPPRRTWVTGKELAESTRLSYGTLMRYNALPDCPVIRVGRRRLYDLDEFMAWLRADGPAKSRRKYADDLRAKHGMEVRL